MSKKTGNKQQQLKELKQGEMFRLFDTDTAPVWVRDEYSREAGKYLVYKHEDANHWSLKKGSLVVFTGFTY